MKSKISPKQLVDSPAFSQGIEVSNTQKTLYIGGQNSVNHEGQLIAEKEFFSQCVQALTNLNIVLEEADYTIDNVVKLTIFYVSGNEPALGFKAFQEVFNLPDIPPVISVLGVAELGHTGKLVEVEAIATK